MSKPVLHYWIVTCKVYMPGHHDPKHKVTASCPTSGICTDSRGQHHSIIIEAPDIEEARRKFLRIFGEGTHITRVELSSPH